MEKSYLIYCQGQTQDFKLGAEISKKKKIVNTHPYSIKKLSIEINTQKLLFLNILRYNHSFHNRTGSGGRTVKIGNRDENWFFKHKEPDFLLIP